MADKVSGTTRTRLWEPLSCRNPSQEVEVGTRFLSRVYRKTFWKCDSQLCKQCYSERTEANQKSQNQALRDLSHVTLLTSQCTQSSSRSSMSKGVCRHWPQWPSPMLLGSQHECMPGISHTTDIQPSLGAYNRQHHHYDVSFTKDLIVPMPSTEQV